MSESATERPVVLIFAGPNGSGKSTVTDAWRELPAFPKNYINADAIARDLNPLIPDTFGIRNKFAADEAERRRKAAIASGESFSFETVLSTIGKLAIIDEAKAAGYDVQLVVVTTSDASINQQRVANRVAKGGHDVDFDKIADRYRRTMDLLPSAIERADSALLYDNSIEGQNPLLVGRKMADKESVTVVVGDPPAWLREKVQIPMQTRRDSVAALTRQAEGVTPDAKVDAAQLHGSKCYSGLVVGSTAEHTLQRLNTSNQFVLHDTRLAHPTQRLELGKAAAIAYRFGTDGKHKVPAIKQDVTQGIKR